MTPLRQTISVVAGATLLISGSGAWSAEAPAFYRLQTILNLGGTGASWDHIDYDPARKLAYLSRRGDGLTVVDVAAGKVVAEVANAKGAGATALAPKIDRGFTANTDGSTTVFKLSDHSTIDRVSFGDNFDGAVYDETTNLVAFEQADNSKELLVDPLTLKLVAAIEVDGTELERPVVDGKGFLYLPLRDKSMVYKIDLKTRSIVGKWDLSAKCSQPSGSEFDRADNRLLLPCRGKGVNPVIAVIDADSGAVTSTVVDGRGADDLILDPETKELFSSNGLDGNITVYKQEGADSYKLIEAFQTRPGLRVMRVDPETHKIYGMVAQGTFDASKKASPISPFYPNTFFPGTFELLTFGRGLAK